MYRKSIIFFFYHLESMEHTQTLEYTSPLSIQATPSRFDEYMKESSSVFIKACANVRNRGGSEQKNAKEMAQCLGGWALWQMYGIGGYSECTLFRLTISVSLKYRFHSNGNA